MGEIIADTKITTPKIAIGKLRGFVLTTIFLSKIVLRPHITSKIRVEAIRRSCFGREKKSVVVVRKKRGNKNSVSPIITFEIVSRYEIISFFSIVDYSL